jgi:L-ascorbate metabolism protein UlaG (beta-lactamase superfamily)
LKSKSRNKGITKMTPAGYSRLFAAAFMGAAFVNAANAQDTVAASQNPDGIYTVFITTRQGDCDKAYHWMISVSGGRVTSAGDTPMEASGHINGGAVDLAFQRMGQVATVTGRLAKGYGSGTWMSSTMGCKGSWRALRQG